MMIDREARKRLFEAVAQRVIASADELTDLDRAIGIVHAIDAGARQAHRLGWKQQPIVDHAHDDCATAHHDQISTVLPKQADRLVDRARDEEVGGCHIRTSAWDCKL